MAHELLVRFLFLYVQQLVLVQQAAAAGPVSDPLLDRRLRTTLDLLSTQTWNLEVARARMVNPDEPDQPLSLLAQPFQLEPQQATAFWLAVARRTLAMLYRTNYFTMDFLGKRVQEDADAAMADFGSLMSFDPERMTSVQGRTQLKTENARESVGWTKNRQSRQHTLVHPRISLGGGPLTASARADSLQLLDFDLADPHAQLFNIAAEFWVVQRPPSRGSREDPLAVLTPLQQITQVTDGIHVWRGNLGAALVLLQAFDIVMPPADPNAIPNYDTWTPAPYEGYQRYIDYGAFRAEGGNYFPNCFAHIPEIYNASTISRWQSVVNNALAPPFDAYNVTMRFYRYVYEFYWPRILHRLTQVTSFPKDYFLQLVQFPDYATHCMTYLPYVDETGPFLPDIFGAPLQQLFAYSFFQLLLEVD